VYELVLLPNSPLSKKSERKKYGLITQFRPIRLTEDGVEREFVEIVFGTKMMPFKDWAYCLLFGETIQALHNGGYTRFLATFLSKTQRLSYREFYESLLNFILTRNGYHSNPFKRIKKLIEDYYHNPEMPQISRILTQPDMMAFLNQYNPDRKGWQLWTYIWMKLSESSDEFYGIVSDFLKSQGIGLDKVMEDLMRFQSEIMLSPYYDPEQGKTGTYKHNWLDYFFNKMRLQNKSYTIRYTDTHMGASHRYELAKNDHKKFVNAALGLSFPYSKFRHFFHQPDKAEVLHE
jgi:hypothetical protein